MKTTIIFALLLIGSIVNAQPALNCECVAPDNGMGTIDIPPDCPDSTDMGDPLLIVDGLPAGTTIEIEGILHTFINIVSGPGGNLGGEMHSYDALLQMNMTGTGALAAFSRMIQMPVAIVFHTGPRNPGDPVQVFPTDMFSLQGSIFGDPDFNQIDIFAGTAFGFPSPGQMTLTELPGGDFNVESFYDLSYQIDFIGAPGSVLDGLSGSTQDSSRFSIGSVCLLPPIPTLGQWGIIILSLVLLLIGVITIRQKVHNTL